MDATAGLRSVHVGHKLGHVCAKTAQIELRVARDERVKRPIHRLNTERPAPVALIVLQRLADVPPARLWTHGEHVRPVREATVHRSREAEYESEERTVRIEGAGRDAAESLAHQEDGSGDALGKRLAPGLQLETHGLIALIDVRELAHDDSVGDSCLLHEEWTRALRMEYNTIGSVPDAQLAGVAAILTFVNARPGAAQNPGPPNLVGRVATEVGAPLADVEVRVVGTSMVAQTDARGTYRFVGAPDGVHALRFRRIGYLPGALEVNVPSVADTITLMMVPSRTLLDTIKVAAQVYVVGGIVVDAGNRAIPGAIVDVIGSARVTDTTDAGGWFNFTSVKSGPLLMRTRKDGFGEGSYSIDLQDSRGIVLHMDSLPTKTSPSKASMLNGFGNVEADVWAETRQRIAQRRPGSRVLPREALAAYSGMSLAEAIQRMDVGSRISTALASSHDAACVLEDGYRVVGYLSLRSFRADNVDFVELYPPGTEPTGSLQRDLRDAGCSPPRSSALSSSRASKRPSTFLSSPASSLESGRIDALYVVIWLR